MRIYRLLQRFLRFSTTMFFRRIEVVGLEHIPADGPVIFCGNHPNSLLDPALITAWCGRIVHFAAKDILFRNRLLRMFLNAAGAVPIQRRKDHGGEGAKLDNSDAFDRLYTVLAQGRAMGIFPEGISHDAASLSRLKTGAARIAFGAANAHPEVRFAVVPCGLHYVHRRRFQSSVLIQFGPPIFIDEALQARYTADERETVRAMTADIEAGIRALTVNADDWETVRVLDGVRRLYQPPRISLPERVELARRFNAEYPRVKDEPAVIALFGRVYAYLARLYDLGLRDADVVRRLRPGEVIRRVARYLTLMVLWTPLALVGAPLHLPIAWLLRYGSWRFAPRKDVVGTTKFLLGFLLLGLTYVVIAGAVGWWAGWPWGLLALFAVPLSGYATVRVLERGVALQSVFNTLARLVTLRGELDELRAERSALSAAVLEAVDRLIPADMDRLFNPGEEG